MGRRSLQKLVDPLITQKRADFLLFKLVVELMNKSEHLTPEGLRKILIRLRINLL